MANDVKIFLNEKEMPTKWYNIQADLPEPLPPAIHPGTKQPVGPQDLAPLFPMEIIKQEVSTERWIEIPEEVQDILRLWRPSALYRARNLEKLLDTPAKIYYKYEGISPSGSHKTNTSVAQAYYNKKEGVKRIATETGAGQWGSALSFACNVFGLKCTVYMVKVSYMQKPYRKSMMQLWGAEVFPSPTDKTNAGRMILKENPDSLGSLGIAISEASEDAATHDDTKYSLGSVLNHVLMHQTVIGLEARKQFEMIGEWPDVVIACNGGGSNFGGIAFPFLMDKLTGKNKKIRAIAVEPAACPTLTKGPYAYDFGDTAGITPLFKMYTLGHTFMPSGIHAGGLRYHGDSPLVSMLYNKKMIEAVAVHQTKVFEAAMIFSRCEGIVPAPESAHAILTAIDEAKKAKLEGKKTNILFNLSGHGLLDLAAYDDYLAGKLTDYEHPEEKIKEALSHLPKL
jgi:tryptophan synthase beta chain